MEDVEYSRRSTEEGAHRDWVPPSARPTKAMVDSLGEVIDVLRDGRGSPCRFGSGPGVGLGSASSSLSGTSTSTSSGRSCSCATASCGPAPGGGIAFGIKPIKTKTRREVPYPGSLHEALLELCRGSLGLPAGASEADVIAAQSRKYSDKFEKLDKATLEKGPRPIEDDEGLLFVDPETGLPPTKEQYGDAWRSQRKVSTWSNSIPWLNARHYTVAFWRATIVDPETHEAVADSTIATWRGHDIAHPSGPLRPGRR